MFIKHQAIFRSIYSISAVFCLVLFILFRSGANYIGCIIICTLSASAIITSFLCIIGRIPILSSNDWHNPAKFKWYDAFGLIMFDLVFAFIHSLFLGLILEGTYFF